jgi:uncharacterized membrane protein YgcG
MRLRAAAVTVLVALAVLAPGAAAIASTQDFSFASMTADYYLGRDAGGNATLRTIETLEAVFPDFDQNHGIERSIPLKYGEARLELEVVSVTDGAGNPLHYSRSDDGGFAVLRVGDADRFVHGAMTYRIEYTQRNVVRSFADTASDEFYWDANGTGWAQPFGRVTATVHLLDGIAADLTGDLACYQGYDGSTDRCEISRDGDTITASATELAPYQTMTFAIGFAQSAFVDPPLLRNHWAFAILPWVLLGLTSAALLFVLLVRLVRWRDARGRGIIVPEYAPSTDVYPMLAAELLHRETAALPAQIVGFAVERALAIHEYPNRAKNARYELELLAGWAAVPKQEVTSLKTLFGKLGVGRRQVLDSGDQRLGDRLAARRTALFQEVRSRGWRAQPVTRLPRIVRWSTFGIAAAAIALWFVATNLEADGSGVWLAAFLCPVGWIVVSAVATPPWVMTETGAAMRDHLYGIRDYLKLAEADRIRMLQAPGTAERVDATDESAIVKLYERLLPYALIFGVEKGWIAELGRHYAQTEAPEWYSGAGDVTRLAVFSNTLGSTNFATTPPPPSTSSGSSWSSSGGSSFSGGSSGGGSAGGGGGGGGGGGW